MTAHGAYTQLAAKARANLEYCKNILHNIKLLKIGWPLPEDEHLIATMNAVRARIVSVEQTLHDLQSEAAKLAEDYVAHAIVRENKTFCTRVVTRSHLLKKPGKAK